MHSPSSAIDKDEALDDWFAREVLPHEAALTRYVAGRARRGRRNQPEKSGLPAIQAVIEVIAKGRKESAPGAGDAVPGRPSKANHLLRYFRVLFGWGMRHGHCKTNPAEGAKQVKEQKRHGMPTRDVYEAVLKSADRFRSALSRPSTQCDLLRRYLDWYAR